MDAMTLLEPAATRVRDPLSGRSAWLAGMVQDGRIDGDVLRFTLQVKPEHAAEDRGRIREAILRNRGGRGWSGEVACTVRVAGVAPMASAEKPKEPLKGMSGPGVQPHGGPIGKSPIPGVRHIVAVASGKGGV